MARGTIAGVAAAVDLAIVWATSPDAMALSDAEGIVVDANPAYYALYALTPEQVLGRSFAIIFPEAERAAAVERYLAVFRSAEPPPTFSVRVVRVGGSERTVESRVGFVERDGQMFPMNEVIADSMPPTHMPPCIAKWIVLIEQVILTVKKYQPIGVIHEILWRREVITWAKSHVLFMPASPLRAICRDERT